MFGMKPIEEVYSINEETGSFRIRTTYITDVSGDVEPDEMHKMIEEKIKSSFRGRVNFESMSRKWIDAGYKGGNQKFIVGNWKFTVVMG